MNLVGTKQVQDSCPQYFDEICIAIGKTCTIVPAGVLCFFPSYAMLEKTVAVMNSAGYLKTLQRYKVGWMGLSWGLIKTLCFRESVSRVLRTPRRVR